MTKNSLKMIVRASSSEKLESSHLDIFGFTQLEQLSLTWMPNKISIYSGKVRLSICYNIYIGLAFLVGT